MANGNKVKVKVLIVNTSGNVGGAAIAASRLMHALRSQGVEADMLSRKKKFPAFYWERLVIWVSNLFSRKNIFAVDIANSGQHITHSPQFREADIIHLHWVNQGFISLSELGRILSSGKPVVWTMHDMWPFTSVCHYSGTCRQYHSQCSQCPLLQSSPCRDTLVRQTFSRKARIYAPAPITFVGCSKWIADQARQSALLAGKTIVHIPNTIDTSLFAPMDRQQCRKAFLLPPDRKLILFTSQKVTDPRKGIRFLYEAIQLLLHQNPQLADQTALIILGGKSGATDADLPVDPATARFLRHNSYPLPYTSSARQMAQIYNSADLFLIPSLQDNLPNTVMEALSCGVPCVGFRTGGIPEMIDHKVNGYVARQSDSQDLKEGIVWALSHDFSQPARQKVLSTYSPEAIAERYIQEYTQLVQNLDSIE